MYAGVRDDTVKWLGKRLGLKDFLDALDKLNVFGVEVYVDRSLKVANYSALGASPDARFDLSAQKDRREFVEGLRAHKAKVSAILIENDFGREDLGQEVKWMVDAASLAPELGTTLVRINSVMSPDPRVPESEYVRRTASAIKDALRQTEGVCFAIENHGVLGNKRDFLRAVLGEVGSERVGLTLDTGNFYWSGYPLTTVYGLVEEFSVLTMHTHIKNLSFSPEQREKTRDWCRDWPKEARPIYEGDIEYEKVLATLKRAGYDGDVTLEDESLSNYPTEKAIEVLNKDAKYLNDLLSAL